MATVRDEGEDNDNDNSKNNDHGHWIEHSMFDQDVENHSHNPLCK